MEADVMQKFEDSWKLITDPPLENDLIAIDDSYVNNSAAFAIAPINNISDVNGNERISKPIRRGIINHTGSAYTGIALRGVDDNFHCNRHFLEEFEDLNRPFLESTKLSTFGFDASGRKGPHQLKPV